MEKRADQGRTRLNVREVRLDAAAERFVLPQRGLADALELEVIPDELVGVQLGRVARQEMQFEASREALDVLRNHLGDVRGVAVEDEKHGALSTAHDVLLQLDVLRAIEPFGVELMPEGAVFVDGGAGAYALAPPARGDLGCLSPQSPRAPEDVIGADPGLIEEEDLRADALGAGAHAGEHRGRPAFDRHRIALIRAPQGFLRRDVQLGEQAPHGGHAHPHPELLRDQRRHDLPRPQPKVEAVLTRVLAIYPATDLELLARRQGGFPPRMFARAEGGRATSPLRRQPFVDRRATQTIAFDDLTGGRALPDPPDGEPADRFRGLARQRPPVDAHASSYHDSMTCVD